MRQLAVRSRHSGIIRAEPGRALRTLVKKGTPLLRLYDALGEEVELVLAPEDGYVMGIRPFQYAPAGWPLVWLGVVTGELVQEAP